MNRILVIDDTEFWRELAADALRAEGYQVMAAEDAAQALKIMRTAGTDLIVLDVEMPHPDGLEFLAEVRREEKWKRIPVIMLTGDVERRHILRAKELGAVDYLLKARFSIEELINRVQKRLQVAAAAPAAAPRQALTVKREKTLATIEHLPQLKALAGTVNAVISLASSPSASVKEVAHLICQDAVLAARVLQVANSAAYVTHKASVSSIEEAAKRIGTTAIANLAVSAGIFDMLHSPGGTPLATLRCWQHSYAAAEIMSILAARTSGIDPSTAHLVGLCHNLDEIILRQRYGLEYAAAEEAAAQSGQPAEQMLPRTFGVSRTELVAHLMGVVRMPRAVALPIQEYASAQAHGDRTGLSALARMLRVADMFASGLMLTASTQAVVAPVSQNDCKAMGISESAIDGAELRMRVVASISMLAKVGAQDQAELSRPLLERSSRKVWYVRQSSLVEMDPLRAALGSLFEVVDRSELPRQSSDIEGVCAIVAASPRADLPGISLEEASSVLRWASPGAPVSLLFLTAPDGRDPHAMPESGSAVHWPVSLSRLAHLGMARSSSAAA